MLPQPHRSTLAVPPASLFTFINPLPLLTILRYVVSWVCSQARFEITDPFFRTVFFLHTFQQLLFTRLTGACMWPGKVKVPCGPLQHTHMRMSRCIHSHSPFAPSCAPALIYFGFLWPVGCVYAFAAQPCKIQTFQGSQQYNMAALL